MVHIIVKKFDANAKAYYALLQALNDDDIFRVISCKFAYDIWCNLIDSWENLLSEEG